jgi:hypothetical protein
MNRQKSAEGIVVPATGTKARTHRKDRRSNFDADGDAARMAEMPESHPEGSGRKPQEEGTGESSGAARRETVRPEESQMMEAVVARENLLDAYRQVMGNKGAAGVDHKTVEQLKPYLQEHWARIRESLLNGTYQPQAVRCVKYRNRTAECGNWPFRQ